MLDLAAKLLLIVVLPLAAVLAWLWRTHAAWTCLLFALGALAVNFAARLLIQRFFPEFLAVFAGNPAFGGGILPFLLAKALAYGLLREGIRWLIFRYAATSLRSWHEGVLFGLGYSVFATLLTIGMNLYDNVTAPPAPLHNVDTTLLSLAWRYLPKWVWDQGPALMIFNVGTSLAVLVSVRRRQAWLFAAAILFWIIDMTAPYFGMQYLSAATLRGSGLGFYLSVYLMVYLPEILAALPPLWLTLHLRRNMAGDARGRET